MRCYQEYWLLSRVHVLMKKFNLYQSKCFLGSNLEKVVVLRSSEIRSLTFAVLYLMFTTFGGASFLFLSPTDS